MNVINPGYIASARLDRRVDALEKSSGRNRDDIYRDLLAGYGIPRFGKPIEIGRLAVFLASDTAAYLHGIAVDIDGARLAGSDVEAVGARCRQPQRSGFLIHTLVQRRVRPNSLSLFEGTAPFGGRAYVSGNNGEGALVGQAFASAALPDVAAAMREPCQISVVGCCRGRFGDNETESVTHALNDQHGAAGGACGDAGDLSAREQGLPRLAGGYSVGGSVPQSYFRRNVRVRITD